MNSNPTRQKPSVKAQLAVVLLFICFIALAIPLTIYLYHAQLTKFSQSHLSVAVNLTPVPTQKTLPTPTPIQWLQYTSTASMGGEVNFQYPSLFQQQPETQGMGLERRQLFMSKNSQDFIEFDRDFSCTYSSPGKKLPVTSIEKCLTSTPEQPLTKLFLQGRESLTFIATESAQDVGKAYAATDYTTVFLAKNRRSIYSLTIRINSTNPTVIANEKALFDKLLSTVTFSK